MLLTGHKSRAIFDRYNIINEQELLEAGVASGPTRPAPPPRPSASCDALPRKSARIGAVGRDGAGHEADPGADETADAGQPILSGCRPAPHAPREAHSRPTARDPAAGSPISPRSSTATRRARPPPQPHPLPAPTSHAHRHQWRQGPASASEADRPRPAGRMTRSCAGCNWPCCAGIGGVIAAHKGDPMPTRFSAGARGKRLLRQRGERLERPFAHLYETGRMRRVHLRSHTNILKRVLLQTAALNLGLLMRTLFGVATPRSLQERAAALVCCVWSLMRLPETPWEAIWTTYRPSTSLGDSTAHREDRPLALSVNTVFTDC